MYMNWMIYELQFMVVQVLTVLPALLLLPSTLLFFAAGLFPDVSGNSAVPNKNTDIASIKSK